MKKAIFAFVLCCTLSAIAAELTVAAVRMAPAAGGSAPGTAPIPTVTLTCNPGTGGTAPFTYNLYSSLTSGGPYTKIAGASGVSQCSFTDTSQQFSTTVYYVATGVGTGCPAGQSCESGFSSQAVAIIPANPVPGAPTGLQVGTIIANSVPLQWQKPSGKAPVTAYRLYRNGKEIAYGIKALDFTDKVPGPGSYNYQATAVDNQGKQGVYEGPPSNTAIAKVKN